MSDRKNMKYTIKDSVFTDFFTDKKNIFRIYQALHPEDTNVTIDMITNITLENIFTDDLYNDLGFMVGNKLLVLAEAQSTWSVNIIIRALEYLVHTYRRYFKNRKIDLYKSKKAKLPKPELYVIFTGNRMDRPEEISLSEEFFGGEQIAVEVKVKIIYDGEKGDVINQYVTFTKILAEQVAIYGRTRKAVQETVHICMNKDVLREYLEKRESEVVDIMMQLYDQEEVWNIHVLNKERDAGISNVVIALQEIGMVMTDVIEKIAVQFDLTQEEAEEEVKDYWRE